MKYGFVTSFGTAKEYVQLAVAAEKHGWDGVFAWDDISVGPRNVFDPWVVLGAMAMATERITIGSMIFSLARRRPWKVARESLTLDQLSDGRLVIPVGLGGTWDGGYANVNTDHPERKTRAELLDECLEILELAWKGEPFDYNGTHYQATDLVFQPRPVQQPRIPIWPVGAWPHEKSLARCAKYDGIIVSDMSSDDDDDTMISPDVVTKVKGWMTDRRGNDDPFEIVIEGETSGTDQSYNAEMLQPLINAGATWFIESRWEDETFESLMERVVQDPPQV